MSCWYRLERTGTGRAAALLSTFHPQVIHIFIHEVIHREAPQNASQANMRHRVWRAFQGAHGLVKIAIVSDVHGNLLALEAVVADLERQHPELVVHGGDLAVNGPQPADVVDRIGQLGWPGVVGNTDEVLWTMDADPQPARALFERLHGAYTPALGEGRIAWLRALPREWRHGSILLVHAAPGDLWKNLLPDTPDDELLATYGGQGADLVVYCHIHRPFVWKIGELTIANSGSVGYPVDGDWRPSYLLIDDDQVSVRRIEYDLEKEIARVRASPFPTRSWLVEVHRRAELVQPVTLDD